jgi:hypothetical protein
LKLNLPEDEILAELPYRYTCPAKENGAYLPQWLWDSCFHAIVYRWFDPSMAWAELQSLLVHQIQSGNDAGMIPHMAYLKENGDEFDQNLFQQANHSIITQPPLISCAALEVHTLNPNPEILASLYEGLLFYHNWFDRRRDLENDHLVAIIHPWESGWDSSQRWDDLMGVDASEPDVSKKLANKRFKLIDLLLDNGCDAAKIARHPEGFYVKPVDFNAIRLADLESLIEIAKIIGKGKNQIRKLMVKAGQIRESIQKNFIHSRKTKLRVTDLFSIDPPVNFSESAAKFILLFGNCCSSPQAKQLVKELFKNNSPYNTRFIIPTTPKNNSSFDGQQYWRGNVWMPVNWLIFRGLINYGYLREAEMLAIRSLDLVSKSGFCEFFCPITGERGMNSGKSCPQNQSWSTLVFDMLMVIQDKLHPEKMSLYKDSF